MSTTPYTTLYDTLRRTVARNPHGAAYAVPPKAGRSYHPDGWEATWAQTLAEVERVKAIYAASGYGAGHRVAILFDQRPEFVFHHFALNALGVSVVPVNPDHRREEIRYLLEDSDAQIAIGIASRREDLEAIAAERGGVCPFVSFEQFPDRLPAPRFAATGAALGPDSEAGLLYTSGTTGKPKGCILTNDYFHSFGGCFAGLGGALEMGVDCERLFNPLPLHHANCLSISLPAALIKGNCLIFPDRFHASTWWQDLVATRATVVQFQGVIPNILLKLPESPLEQQHQVRFALCAGCEPNLHPLFEERFGIQLVEMWAMTETGRIISANEEPRMIDTRAFGRNNPWIEALVVDENDREVPAGTPGELVVRHSAATPRKGFFSGYLNNPEATEVAWRNGWFHTGDAVVRDASGMLFFLDRRKNIIRRAGENIAAAEIEACIVDHPRVAQVAVLAVPDEVREEEVMACVVARDAAEVATEAQRAALAQAVFDWCNERMAYFKAPGFVLFVDKLPTGTSAKVQKIHLFPQGVDPRMEPGVIDFRASKKQHKPTPARHASAA